MAKFFKASAAIVSYDYMELLYKFFGVSVKFYAADIIIYESTKKEMAVSRSSILKSNVRSRILSVSSLASLENSAIIDIRSRSAYLADHIANSVNLTTKDEILDFIERNPKAQYILCCFSSTRAQNLAKQIDNPLVKFYDGNLIEAKESGVQFTSSDNRFIALLNDTGAQILARYKKYTCVDYYF